MRTLIIFISIHHGNTKKLAKAMAEILDAELLKPNKVDPDTILKYDLIGFGSGIYYWKHHKALINLIEGLPAINKKAFIFSTRGAGPSCLYHRPLKNRLKEKGFNIVGEFSCKGFDTVGVLKLIGGINRAHPDEKELNKARTFAKRLKNKISS